MEQRVAFFDIDGTFFRSSLLIELVEELIAQEIFPQTAHDTYHAAHMAWLDRRGSYKTYIDAVVTSFKEHIKGVHYGAFADVAKIVVAQQKGRVYTHTRDLIKRLQHEDYFLVAISHSPKTVLDALCPPYGFNKVYGSLYEVGAGDRFTGNTVEEEVWRNKANIVRRVLEKHDLTLEDSVAVGDTESDIPMLEQVASPICFNPNALLYAHAKRLGWEVVVERKDVVYII